MNQDNTDTSTSVVLIIGAAIFVAALVAHLSGFLTFDIAKLGYFTGIAIIIVGTTRKYGVGTD